MENSCKVNGDNSAIFKLVINSLPVGLFVFDKLGHIIEVNPAAESLCGYSRDELIGKCCGEMGDGLFDMIVPEDKDIENRDGEGGAVVREAVLIRKDGERIPVLYFDSALKDENNHICGLVKMFRDIAAEKKMRKKHRILISMFAHDLKAPVAIAGGFLSRLLMGKAGDLNEKQKNYLTVIDNELKKLDNHIHSFLDVLRMEAGEIKLSLEKCSLEKIIYDVVNEFNEQAASRDISLSVSTPEQNILVMVDREQMQRVLVNLVDNAIKYSPPHNEVNIVVEDHDQYVVCKVIDKGSGIPEDDIPYIFDPFFRASSQECTDDTTDGTGIGLAVVKSIVEAHNGKVWVNSILGKGTTFSFSIPKATDETSRVKST